ncbi:MAG: homoserine dehydrogenase [Clostridia bacterium]|nr:homoserine dehydrogenase [Clostridia bacterium]
MTKMAIMGYGVVGSGVYDIVTKNADTITDKTGDELKVKYILDIRDFDDHPEKHLFVKDADIIAADDEVTLVAEAMGGATFAYEFTKKMLLVGKSVVTSNKELVSKKGTELFRIAKEKNVSYMFEASVGGGIPIIRPLVNCLAANRIQGIYGIMNGTTNYILTKMFKENQSFDVALSDAKRLGYAEQDPTADVEGFDTMRKISILTSLATGWKAECDKIPTEGITKISAEDVACAEKLGCSVKLIGYSKIVNGKVTARVCPMLIPSDCPLYGVEDVFNAILVKGDMVGDVMMYGRGAGKEATASAIVGDLMDVVRHKGVFDKNFSWDEEAENGFADSSDELNAFFVRCEKTKAEIEKVFNNVKFVNGCDNAFVTEEMTEKEFEVKTASLGGILSKIRVYK